MDFHINGFGRLGWAGGAPANSIARLAGQPKGGGLATLAELNRDVDGALGSTIAAPTFPLPGHAERGNLRAALAALRHQVNGALWATVATPALCLSGHTKGGDFGAALAAFGHDVDGFRWA